MATLVLQYAGAAAGAMIGGPAGAIIGRAVGAVAGNFLDHALFGGGTTRRIDGPRLSDLRVMSSAEGSSVPRLWGRMRVAGQVIWATNFEEVVSTKTTSASGKSGGSAGKTKVRTYNYFANFAVALCEGEIDRIGRVWADGKPLDMSELTFRLYRGTETQQPDSLILAKEGQGNAPAYRGLAYIVFERMPINAFGNRLPQLSFEVMRAGGGSESLVRAVNIIPGSTEFGYDTEVQTRDLGAGITESENAHAAAGRSDWTVSIDELQETCRNVAAASLVVAWFADDLRCGQTTLKPGVESTSKQTEPADWRCAGLARGAAHLVSSSNGAPAFGGTPSDRSVIRALQDLKARGLKAVFYPFILVDVPAGNALPDPYGGAAQARYPWRGRITCFPAAGQPGSADGTATAASQLTAFIGTAQPQHFGIANGEVTYSGPAEWSYRRMILHYAKLCALAGGVEAFIIGSELRGLTTVRGPGNTFPFVSALRDLAADVRAILPLAKISYAADWSEYWGCRTSTPGEIFFHLDPLWSSSDIGFVGIDNYMPLSDWRDGAQHADQLAGARSIYESSYLRGNIAGGEGFDWFYADDAARRSQTRTPITDGAYGKPWVFRYKDLKSWWLNPHFNRPGGVQAATPTAWAPQSKPFWFTELGCPAIDKGSNQPSAFIDAKSSESLRPSFSSGRRDDEMQNSFLAAHAAHWASGGSANPVSQIYGRSMVDQDRIFIWAWDARPFPYFPARSDVWADGANYATGHWLNGRIGNVPLPRLVANICADYGVADVDTQEVEGQVEGFLIDRGLSARDALEGLLAAFAIDAVERNGTIAFRLRRSGISSSITVDEMVELRKDAPLFALTRRQETELPAAVRIAYLDADLEYRRGAVEARQLGTEALGEINIELPCATSQSVAQARADILLREAWTGRESLEFTLLPSRIELEPGDVVSIGIGGTTRSFRIDGIADGEARRVRARSHQAAIYDPPLSVNRSLETGTIFVFGTPDGFFLDLPVAGGEAVAHAPWIAANATPWLGQLSLHRAVGTSFAFNRLLEAEATKGTLLDALPAGALHVFDRTNSFRVKLDHGALSSVSEAELLQGENRAAVGTPGGSWEIIQFGNAVLVGQDIYLLSNLLRGQSGSDPEMLALREAGARFVLLSEAVVQPEMQLAEARLPQTWKLGPAQYDLSRKHLTLAFEGRMLGLRPLAPCRVKLNKDQNDLVISWIRRTRIDGDGWEVDDVPLGEEAESYQIEIVKNGAVKRRVTVKEPSYRYTSSQVSADFGAQPASLTVRIAQMSATFGRGTQRVENLNA